MRNPKLEAIKEALRLGIFILISWVITATLGQINVVPGLYDLHVGPFVYTVPVQAILISLLTLIGRYSDKYIFERSKWLYTNPKGILPF